MQPQTTPTGGSRGWWGCLLGCCAGGTLGAAALVVIAIIVTTQLTPGDLVPGGGSDTNGTIPPTASGAPPHADDPAWGRLQDSPITDLTVPTLTEDNCTVGDGPTDPAADPQAYEEYLQTLAACLDELWKPILEEAGADATPVEVRVGDPNSASGACLAPQEPTTAYYCPSDHSITFTAEEDYGAGSEAPGQVHTHYLWVLDHEYAHHVQDRFGIFDQAWTMAGEYGQEGEQDLSHRIELQAACIGEATLAQGTGKFTLTRSQRRHQSSLDSYIADDTHGTAESQMLWSMRGLNSGGSTSVCDTFSAQPEDVA